MSNAPIQYPYENEIRSESAGAQIAHRGAFQGILDLNQAVAFLTGKVNSVTKTTGTVAGTGTENVTENTTVINETVSGGAVNNQTGVTAYSTLQSDNGAILVFADASPVAVTLSIGLTIPWYCFPVNQGAGTVTLTPASGTINGSASITILQGYFAVVAFDGTNFFAGVLPIVPVNTPGVTHQWIASYNAATGVFTLSQPAISDVSGLSAALALLAPIASPTFTGPVTQPDSTVLTAATTATSATAGAATALPATPLGYLQQSVNGVTVKIPYYSV